VWLAHLRGVRSVAGGRSPCVCELCLCDCRHAAGALAADLRPPPARGAADGRCEDWSSCSVTAAWAKCGGLVIVCSRAVSQSSWCARTCSAPGRRPTRSS
jgi:hypothetical protein